ncbi:MAG TPA: CheR family methyltransferase [Candidatus Nanoarchaeia archaeon]|nr:CheR family methyltransferase [Candidatus Nanoarchaeia archaeon]
MVEPTLQKIIAPKNRDKSIEDRINSIIRARGHIKDTDIQLVNAALGEFNQLDIINNSLGGNFLPAYEEMANSLEAEIIQLGIFGGAVKARKEFTGIDYSAFIPKGSFELLTVPSSILAYENFISRNVVFKDNYSIIRLNRIFYGSHQMPAHTDEACYFRCMNSYMNLGNQLIDRIEHVEQSISKGLADEKSRSLRLMSAGTNRGLEAYSQSVIIEEVIDFLSNRGLSEQKAQEWKKNSFVFAVDNDVLALLYATLNRHAYEFVIGHAGQNRLHYGFVKDKLAHFDRSGAYFKFKEGQVKERVKFGYMDLRKLNPDLINGFDAIFCISVPSLDHSDRAKGSVYSRLLGALNKEGVLYWKGGMHHASKP